MSYDITTVRQLQGKLNGAYRDLTYDDFKRGFKHSSSELRGVVMAVARLVEPFVDDYESHEECVTNMLDVIRSLEDDVTIREQVRRFNALLMSRNSFVDRLGEFDGFDTDGYVVTVASSRRRGHRRPMFDSLRRYVDNLLS